MISGRFEASHSTRITDRVSAPMNSMVSQPEETPLVVQARRVARASYPGHGVAEINRAESASTEIVALPPGTVRVTIEPGRTPADDARGDAAVLARGVDRRVGVGVGCATDTGSRVDGAGDRVTPTAGTAARVGTAIARSTGWAVLIAPAIPNQAMAALSAVPNSQATGPGIRRTP